jgi:hypothetical protein
MALLLWAAACGWGACPLIRRPNNPASDVNPAEWSQVRLLSFIFDQSKLLGR